MDVENLNSVSEYLSIPVCVCLSFELEVPGSTLQVLYYLSTILYNANKYTNSESYEIWTVVHGPSSKQETRERFISNGMCLT